jgi:hypothetical protein
VDLFRRPARVSVDEIDALLGLRPLRDDVLGYLLQRAVEGVVPVYFAAVPRMLIHPFDTEYDPAKHPVGAAAIAQTMAEWRSGHVPHVWVYPRGAAYVLSDDYIPWAAALRGQPDFLPCWVLGYPSVAGTVDIQGPVEPQRVRRLLGFGDSNNEERLISRDDARAIADLTIRERGLGSGVRHLCLLEEIAWRPPQVYNGPSLAECWIAYVERPMTRLGASSIVLISKKTGEVLYAGGANDEG